MERDTSRQTNLSDLGFGKGKLLLHFRNKHVHVELVNVELKIHVELKI